MKYKFKRLWVEWKDVVLIGIAFMALFGLFAVALWANHNAEKNNPMDSTSEKGIRAKSFEYKGHQYILFKKSNFFGESSVVHDPDCSHDR
jgi:hypothetical protein